MTGSISPTDAAEYLARWRELATRESELARADSMALRLQQLCAMFDARHLFPAYVGREREAEALRDLWQRLRESGIGG